MSVVLITGAHGLIGSEAVEYYGGLGYKVIGIDNNMRQVFFGEDGSTSWNKQRLEKLLGSNYQHYDLDIRDIEGIKKVFVKYNSEIALIIHAAAQPSHDWAAREPLTDFGINAVGTLNLLECMRQSCPEAVFIFTSTNKVYGDRPNNLPLIEKETRWEIDSSHPYLNGISEDMNVDQCMHSLFGASKLAADILVQEYGRYFGFKTAVFRGGVLSGAYQSGAQLHGFINYLMRCVMTGTPYTVFGYKGKQVRDVIHSSDVIQVFDTFFKNPRLGGEVYNLGGGRESNISMFEAIELAQRICGKELIHSYVPTNRAGDHIWYISNMEKFKKHYPDWKLKYNSIDLIMEEIFELNKARWR